ncbi:hypothetical protein GF374_02165 [Candidatus Woesearchaeota archaeon]|nr:hypothetical protein [Candidatus Woesearchaeota archaeon]
MARRRKKRKFSIEEIAKIVAAFNKSLKKKSKKKHGKKKKERLLTMPLKQQFRSEHYDMMRAVASIMFVLLIVIGVVLAYGIANFYGFDMSNQITGAAIINQSAIP